MPQKLPLPPEHALEMLYHRHLGYGLFQDEDTGWDFASAFRALKIDVTEGQLRRYRNIFIERGWGQFDGANDPSFRITRLGQSAARKSIVRRKPIYAAERLRSYDWPIFGAVAAIVAAFSSIAVLLKAT